MGERVRTQLGSTLLFEARQGAPGPGRASDEESMSIGIRELIRCWGGETEPCDDEERLAVLRRGRQEHET